LNFSFFIAKRYLISKKSHNAINIISFISIIGVSVGAAALIIILSVFNGFDDLLKKLYNSFDPDIKIISQKSKHFVIDQNIIKSLNQSDFIEYYSLSLEENAMIEYNQKQVVTTIKGVDKNYTRVTGIDTMLVRGEFLLKNENIFYSVCGQGIAYNLGLDVQAASPVGIYVPSRKAELRGNILDATDAINKAIVYNAGIFSIQQEYDTKYFLIDINLARRLLEYENEVSAIEIKLKKDIKNSIALSELKKIFGPDFKVLDRNMQHEYAYKIMKSEKWAIFMILVFILLIASFNVIGSLTMLIVEKKEDINIFRSLGTDVKTIRNIFFYEGILISIAGAIMGLIFGLIICWLQMEFGLVKLGNEGSFIIENYPVMVKSVDVGFVFITVIVIGLFAAWFPVRYITRKFANLES
jgi:lipoprotein-releasing system permease protein